MVNAVPSPAAGGHRADRGCGGLPLSRIGLMLSEDGRLCWEAPVTPGLILLVFLGLLCAFFYTRARRRMGLPVAGKHWTTVIIGVVLIMLTVWVAQQ
ncbi:MAG TPA: hypothetical protein VII59_06540 [Streptosporangiaceae bacterium]